MGRRRTFESRTTRPGPATSQEGLRHGHWDSSGGQRFPVSADEAWRHLNLVASQIGRVKESDDFLKRMIISTGASAFTWGENITVSIEPVTDQTCNVVVGSHAKASWAIGVMGNMAAGSRNSKHVEKVISVLSASLRAWRQKE